MAALRLAAAIPAPVAAVVPVAEAASAGGAVVVGLAGRARSGKDTLADALVARLGFVKIAVADPLREACAATFGVSVADLASAKKDEPVPASRFFGADVRVPFVDGDGAREDVVTPRQVMQVFGTDLVRRTFGEDAWLRVFESRLDAALAAGKNVVVPDVRFRNEAAAIARRPGGVMLRLVRETSSDVPGADHESERGEFPAVTLINRGTVDDLVRRALDAIR